jgi:antitoxin VapB
MTAKLFSNGRSQAVRLPKEFRFEGREVGIAKFDDVVILYPKGKGWEVMAKAIPQFTDDYMATRNQPKKSQRRAKL